MHRRLLLLVALMVLLRLGWTWLSKLPIGRLPGDFVFDTGDMLLRFPIMSIMLVAIVVIVIMQLFK